jgi:hypothetical protein
MNDIGIQTQDTDNQTQEETNFLKTLRKSIFPINPGDGALVRIIKDSAFYTSFVLFALVSTTILIAIMMCA